MLQLEEVVADEEQNFCRTAANEFSLRFESEYLSTDLTIFSKSASDSDRDFG